MNKQLLSDFLDILTRMAESYDTCNCNTNYIVERMLCILFSRIFKNKHSIPYYRISSYPQLKMRKGFTLANLTRQKLPVFSDDGFGYIFEFCNDVYAETNLCDNFSAAIGRCQHPLDEKTVTLCQKDCLSCKQFMDQKELLMESDGDSAYLQEDFICLTGIKLKCLLQRIYHNLFDQPSGKDFLQRKDPYLYQLLESVYGNYALRAPGYLQAAIDFVSFCRDNSELNTTSYGKYHGYLLPTMGKTLNDYIRQLCDTDLSLFRRMVTLLDALLQMLEFSLVGDLSNFSDAEHNTEITCDCRQVGSTVYGNVLLLYIITDTDEDSDNRTNNKLYTVEVNFLIAILTYWIRECITSKEGADKNEGN